MGASAAGPKHPVLSRASARLAAYSAAVEPAVRALVLAACTTTFLQSAGTLELVYTVRPSFVLMAIAVALGLPLVWRGWRSAPAWVSWSAAALAATYLICALLNTGTTTGLTRAGAHRELAYLGDLAIGLGGFGLVNALWANGVRVRDLMKALVLSGALAAAYAVYQWPAQIFGWPFADVLSVADSNAVTSGGSQGAGLFGHERVRGTFLEPHFLGTFLASILPLTFALAAGMTTTRRRVPLAVAAALMLLALVFTASAPAWAVLLTCVLGVAVCLWIGRGHSTAAAVAAALFVTFLFMVPVTTAYPGILSDVTGRSSADLALTSDFRIQTWDRAIDIWSRRPVAGYGPGQSSVQLTLEISGQDAPGLLSAQGVWAAALIDCGVVGLGFWLLLLGGIVGRGLWSLVRRPSVQLAALTIAALVAVASALISGDRLDLRVWVLLGMLAAIVARAAPPPGQVPRAQRRQRDQDASAGSAQSPPRG